MSNNPISYSQGVLCMARMKKDDLTGDLLSWQPVKITKEYEKQAVKAHDASAKYAKAIALTLSECPLNREEIAEQMSVILNETFSKNMLDAYAAETRPSHMISLARLEAFMQVTGDIRILSLLADGFKCIVVDGMFSHLIKSVQLRDKAAELAELERHHKAKYKHIASMRGFDV